MTVSVPYYKALVVCPRALRPQWLAEAGRFFPQATAAVVHTAGAAQALDALWDEACAADTPMVAICSYETVRIHTADLAGYVWDDLVLDEATILRNPGSQRSKAMWQLRETSDVGVALTGTPIQRDADDMAAVIAWARANRRLFHRMRLSSKFDPLRDTDTRRVHDALGPVMFRRDRSEISAELPDIQTETVLLDPEPAEVALAEAARTRLADIFADLTARVDEAAALDPDDERLAVVQAQLREVRSMVAAGITLARMAACDPVAVAQSKSAAARLLDGEGLVAPAVRAGSTKRKQVSALVADLAAAGEAVLIFTDFVSLIDPLIGALRSHGVRAAALQGGMTERAVADAQDGFQGAAGGVLGDDVRYDCLVLSPGAKQGLNLQRASVLIHYDLPWVPTDLIQRVGRASRIGSTADTLQVLIPVMAGTIEQRAAAKLVSRAAVIQAMLDDPRGVHASDTEVGQAVAGLLDAAVAEDSDQQALLDFARSVLV